MGGGRKNLKRTLEEGNFTAQPGQIIMQVVSLRGSNLIEVMDARGEKSLALFPAKFQKSMWIKRGSFVVVDESGREEALESGSKVACIVSQVLFHEQVRQLQKSPEWPEAFKSQTVDSSTRNVQEPSSEQQEQEMPMSDDDDDNDDDDDGLPPLEINTNRIRPFELHPDPDSDSAGDLDP